jgi:hypothetical protein
MLRLIENREALAVVPEEHVGAYWATGTQQNRHSGSSRMSVPDPE